LTDGAQNIWRLIHFIRHSRFARLIFLFVCDLILISGAYYLAYWLRLDAFIYHESWGAYEALFWKSAPLLVGIRLLCNWVTRQYAWSFSHAGLQEAALLFFSAVGGSLAFWAVNYSFTPFQLTPPRSVYVMEACLSFLLMGALRFGPKYVYSIYCRKRIRAQAPKEALPTLVYGAGGNAELLVRELLRTTGHSRRLVGFIDDSASKRHIFICGLKVFGSVEDLPELIPAHKIKEILIAIPDFSGAPLRRLMDICAPFGISYKMVPRYQRVLDTPVDIIDALEEIKPEALINRSPVPFDGARLAEFYCGQTALVTGAAGSIGSEICWQLASYGVRRLILFDINENGIFFLYNDLKIKHPAVELEFEIGSIQDEQLMGQVMAKYRPDIVLHAAAHKHVPLMESCPLEAVKNNVLGTLITCRAARKAGVRHFLLISTDKAAAPANVMGATKRLAELVLQSLHCQSMRCTVVRFGNVLGSNGSLIQIIQRQIKRGGPVTITDPRMSRFFMTIPEAIGLILVTPILRGPNTYVLEMGESVSIDKLVRNVVSLAGLVPGRDIDIVYTQKRPGEKYHEVLTNETETLEPTEHQGIWAVRQAGQALDLEGLLEGIKSLDAAYDSDLFQNFIRCYVPEYQTDSPEGLLKRVELARH